MGKKKCCQKVQKKGKPCKSCPLLSLVSADKLSDKSSKKKSEKKKGKEQKAKEKKKGKKKK